MGLPVMVKILMRGLILHLKTFPKSLKSKTNSTASGNFAASGIVAASFAARAASGKESFSACGTERNGSLSRVVLMHFP